MAILRTYSELMTAIFVIISVYIARYYYRYFTRLSPLPGPLPIPLLGNLHQMGTNPEKFLMRMQAKYGDMFELYTGSERNIYLCRADLLEKMNRASKDTIFFNRGSQNEGLTELGLQNRGISFNLDVPSWRFYRKILSQAITSPNFLNDFIDENKVMFQEAEIYWNKLGSDAVIDFVEWITRLNTDLTLKTTTGKKFHSLTMFYNSIVPNDKQVELKEISVNEAENFINKTKMWMWIIQYFYFFPHAVRHYVPGFRQYTKSYINDVKEFDKIIKDMVEERRQEIEKLPIKTPPLQNDILSRLLVINTTRDENPKSDDIEETRPLTDDEVRCNLLEVIIGGIQTSAQTFCYIIYYVCQNPAVKARLLQEIHQIIGNDPSQFTYDMLAKLDYAEAIIKESQRMANVAGLVFKEMSNDDEIAGYKFKAGTLVFAYISGIHMNKAHWQDPEKFIPDRFLKTVEKNSFMPFGGGVRLCPGKHVAIASLKALMVLLFGKYEVELVNPNQPLKIVYKLGNACQEMKVYLTPKVKV